MKVEIVPPPTRPALARGQLWQHHSGSVYIAVRPINDIILINAETFASRWADVGFNGAENEFTYVGTLKVTL